MPDSFKNAYPNLRCTLGCSELFCQSPSSLKVQSSLYSFYKHRVTYVCVTYGVHLSFYSYNFHQSTL